MDMVMVMVILAPNMVMAMAMVHGSRTPTVMGMVVGMVTLAPKHGHGPGHGTW